MAWTTIPDANLAPDAKVRSADALALRDNPIAIANGDAGAPPVQVAALAGTGSFFSAEVSAPGSVGYHDVTLDATRDWRGKLINVSMMVSTFAASAGYCVGGANEASISRTEYTSWVGRTYGGIFDGVTFYSGLGSANRAVLPYLRTADGGGEYWVIWVNAAGNLMFSWYEHGATSDFCDYNIFVTFS